MAEKEGFEPSRPIKDLRAFQARPFNHLGISPARFIIAIKKWNVINTYCSSTFK
jgi:hypothetical protein